MDQLSAFLGARRLDESGALVPIPKTALRDEWETLCNAQPEAFQVPRRDRVAWHLRCAALAESRQNWSGARQHLTWLLENDARRWPLLLRLGRACSEQGDLENAVDNFTQAIDCGATHWLTWYFRAQLHLKRGAWADACADYEVTFGRSPWNRQVASDLVLLAATHKTLQEFERLVDALLEGSPKGALDSVLIKARITRPALLTDANSTLAAIETRYTGENKAISCLPLLAPLLYRVGRYPEAQTAFAELESKSGRRLDSWHKAFYAMTLMRLGQTRQAISLFSQVKSHYQGPSAGSWREVLLLKAIVKETGDLIGK